MAAGKVVMMAERMVMQSDDSLVGLMGVTMVESTVAMLVGLMVVMKVVGSAGP